jgi:AraC family transcriptional regulator, transcriptional activator of pobA
MSVMTELTVDDLRAEPDTLEVIRLRLPRIGDGEVRPPHRHAYHELIWVRKGSGRHLIDGEPVEFRPHTLTLIAKGQVHQFQRAENVIAVVARFEDDWLTGSRRWLFSGQSCTALSVPDADAAPFDALLEALRVEVERPPGPESAELRRHLLSAVLLWAQRWREGQLEEGGASPTDLQLYQQFQELLERDLAASHEAGHYAAELGVTTGTLSRVLTKLTGQTTKQLILDRVVLEAVRLLRFSDLTIKEIAARLGFGDQFAFSKAFKRQRGGGGGGAGGRRSERRSRKKAWLRSTSGAPPRPDRRRSRLRVLDLVVREEEALGVPVRAQRAQGSPGVLVEEEARVDLALLEVEGARARVPRRGGI